MSLKGKRKKKDCSVHYYNSLIYVFAYGFLHYVND